MINLKCVLASIAVLGVSAALCAAQSVTPSQDPPPAPEAQQTPAPPPVPNGEQSGNQKPPASGKDTNDEKKSAPEGTSNDRLFFALPNFLTIENAGHIPPLSAGQKFKVVARGSFDYVQIPWYAFLAGIGQAQNSEAGYGQGAEGYFKRFGAYAADGTIENFFTEAILPSMLHQDPRYFQKGRGGLWSRAGYAMSRIVVTRTDAGHSQFNFSEIFGSAAASAISTYSYHPSEDRTVSNTAKVWGTQMGYDTITFVVKEFWPDIRRKLKKQPH